MYVCICNNISSKDLEKDPSLIDKVGSKCGKCIAPNNAQSCYKRSLYMPAGKGTYGKKRGRPAKKGTQKLPMSFMKKKKKSKKKRK